MNWNEQLFKTVSDNKPEGIALCLHHGADINVTDEQGFTPLMRAIVNGYIEVATQLINNDANLNIQSDEGYSALIVAAKNNHRDLVNALIAKRADVNLLTGDGDSALIYALIQEHWLIAKKLIDNNSRVNVANDDDDDTALILATNALGTSIDPEIEFDVIKLLIQRGANVNAVNIKGYTPLINAAINDHEQITAALIEASANNVFQRNRHDCTALAYTAETGNLSLVKKLIDTQNSLPSTDENLANQNLNLALSLALEKEHKAVVSLLYSQENIRLNATNRPKITALKKAESKNFTRLALSLGLHRSVGSFDLIDNMHSFLHHPFLATSSREAITHSVNEHHHQSQNKTLFEAASYGDLNKLQRVINKITNINTANSRGHTALMMASAFGHLHLVNALLDAGANPSLKSANGNNALRYACSRGHLAITSLLRRFTERVPDEPKAKRQKTINHKPLENDNWSARFFNDYQSFDCDDKPLEQYQRVMGQGL